jgi:hypothetical protein
MKLKAPKVDPDIVCLECCIAYLADDTVDSEVPGLHIQKEKTNETIQNHGISINENPV